MIEQLLVWPILTAMSIIMLIVQGLAMWYSAKKDRKIWFVVLLMFGLIPAIIYFIWFRGKSK